MPKQKQSKTTYALIHWFIKTFNESAMENGNSETVHNVKAIIPNETHTDLLFTVDCGRQGVWPENWISISKNSIQLRLREPIEGGDLEGDLKKKIELFFEDREVKLKKLFEEK